MQRLGPCECPVLDRLLPVRAWTKLERSCWYAVSSAIRSLDQRSTWYTSLVWPPSVASSALVSTLHAQTLQLEHVVLVRNISAVQWQGPATEASST